MICKQCEKNKIREGSKGQFCGTLCRNFYVSEKMVMKAKAVKKEYGNDYYVKGLGNDDAETKE